MARERKNRSDEPDRLGKDSPAMPPREIGKPWPDGSASRDGAPDKGNDFPIAGDDQNLFA